MELNVSVVTHGRLVLAPLEWVVRERNNCKLSVIRGRQAPLVVTGRLYVTTERLLFSTDSGTQLNSLSLSLADICEMSYNRVARQRKLVTIRTFTADHGTECTLEIYLFGADLKHLIASLFSMRDSCLA